MKRMYVTLGLIVLFFIWALTSFGQKKLSPEEEFFQRRQQLREEMHRRMRDHLINGFGEQEDIFKDMDVLFEDAFKDLGTSFSVPQSYKSEWSETGKGRRLTLVPQRPEQKLDISIANGMMTIKGEDKNSQFTNSFSVPSDCDASKVKISQEKGAIVVDLPYLSSGPKKLPEENGRRPLPPSKDDVSI